MIRCSFKFSIKKDRQLSLNILLNILNNCYTLQDTIGANLNLAKSAGDISLNGKWFNAVGSFLASFSIRDKSGFLFGIEVALVAIISWSVLDRYKIASFHNSAAYNNAMQFVSSFVIVSAIEASKISHCSLQDYSGSMFENLHELIMGVRALKTAKRRPCY